MRVFDKFPPAQAFALVVTLGLGALCTAGCSHDDTLDPPAVATQQNPAPVVGAQADSGPPGSSSLSGHAGSASNPHTNPLSSMNSSAGGKSGAGGQ